MTVPLHSRLETFNHGREVFAAFVSRYSGRQTISPHFHPRLELVVFSAVGGEIRVGSHHRSIEDSHCYIIGPDTIHSYELVPRQSDHAAWVLVVDLEAIIPSLAPYGTRVKELLLDGFSGMELAVDTQGELSRCVTALAEGSLRRSGTPEGALHELSGLFHAIQLALTAAGTGVVPSRSHGAGPVARKVIALIRQRYHESLSLDGIAVHCAVSKYHLCRLFREATGLTIGGYLSQVRIDRACTFLSAGANVTQACNESGFGNLSYFSKIFRAHTGKSPGVWARDATAPRSGEAAQ
jgi:AraC-like DNA-binding protein